VANGAGLSLLLHARTSNGNRPATLACVSQRSNEGIIQELYERWEAEPPEWAPLDLLHEEVVAVAPDNPDVGEVRGREKFAAWVGKGQEAYAQLRRDEPPELTVKGDVVLALVWGIARPWGAKREIHQRVAHIWTLHGGLVIRLEILQSVDEGRTRFESMVAARG
jgi:SnoaL-like protein